jgi:hypothetical protein
MARENVKRLLALGWVGRLAYGTTALLAPRNTIRAFVGRDYPVEQDTGYFNRVFGVREIVLGGATMIAYQRKRGMGAAVAANLASETGDLVALLLEIRERGDVDPLMRVAIGMNLAGLGTYLTAAFLLKNGTGTSSSASSNA